MNHFWGEKDFDWNGLNEAIKYMSKFMIRWGRLGNHPKEKYGTARLYMWPYSGGLFSLFYPGYVSTWPWSSKPYIGKYLIWLEHKVYKFTNRLGLYKPVNWWQLKVYNRAYQNALKKWPHLAEEILEDAEWPDYITDWHRHMWNAQLNYANEMRDKWLKTADFYQRAIALVGAQDTPEIVKLVNEYKEFDQL